MLLMSRIRIFGWTVAAALIGFSSPGIAGESRPVNLAAASDKFSSINDSSGSGAASLINARDGRRVAPDIARIIDRGELIVAMVASDTAPFFYMKDGKLTGTDVDMAEAIARELKVNVRFDRSAKTFNQVVEVVADGRADIGISKLARTLRRAQQIVYSDPYLSLRHGLLVNRMQFAKIAGNRSIPETMRNFTGKICTVAGTSWEEAGQRYFPKATRVPFRRWDECVNAVKQGQVTAAYRDEFEVRTILRKQPDLALTLRTIVFSDLESSLAIAVNSRNPVLLGFINQFISLRPDKLDLEMVLQQDSRSGQ
jgi:polar amino acid transport system substrate-binding protein